MSNIKEFDINNFKINTNYIIEASAGTGKTYNIIEIVSKLLKNKISLNKILIVTYTEKATSELKNRIKSKLIEAKLNENINNAEIYTIHSFCKKIIDEFPITGNFISNMNMAENSIIEEFADIYIRENEYALKLITDCEYGTDKLKKQLIDLTKKYYLDKNGKENSNIVHYSIDNINVEDIDEYSFLKNAEKLDEVLNDSRFSIIKVWYNELIKDRNSSTINEKDYKNINDRFVKYEKGFPKSGNAKNKLDKYNDCWNYLNDYNVRFNLIKNNNIGLYLLRDFYIKWINYKQKFKLEDFNDMIRLVHEEVLNNQEFLNKLKDKYTYIIIDEFQDTNQLQYDIFKQIFLNDDNHHMIVVGDPKQSIYSFQGTDFTVYKKAIEEIEKDKSGIKESLSKNYRSSKVLVEGVNELIDGFKEANNEFNSFNDFKWSTSINLKEDGKEFCAWLDDAEIEKPIWIATSAQQDSINSDKNKDNNIIEPVIDEDEYSDIVVSQIVSLCSINEHGKTRLQVEEKTEKKQDNKRNVSFKDFCILCRTRPELDKIKYKLKKYGIPYLLYKDTSLFNSRECAHFISMLEAIVTPNFAGQNRNIYKKVLFTDFFGLDLKTIYSDYALKDDTPEMLALYNWKKIASKYDWAELVDALLNDSNLRKNNSGPGHMQSLFNYIQIGQFILNSLTKGNNLNDVIKKINDMKNHYSSDDNEEDVTLVERCTDFDAVKIMTMHAAKGLEFPIVISAGGLRKLSSKYNACIHHENGKAILKFESNVNKDGIEEIKRLFYVAYTRAKYLLIVPLYSELSDLSFINNTIKNLIDNNSQYIKTINSKNDLCKDLEDKVKTILSSGNNSDSDNLDNTSNKQQLIETKSSQLTHMHSYSSLSHAKTLDQSEENQEEIVEDVGYIDKENNLEIVDLGLSEYDSKYLKINTKEDSNISAISLSKDFPRGSRIGTVLHEVFEKIDFKNCANIDSLIKECFSHEGIKIKDKWVDDVKNIVSNVLEAKLEEIHGSEDYKSSFSLNELDMENRLSEIEFNFNFKDNSIKDYCNGFMDLVFKRGDYYSILDWKSDSLKDDFTSYSSEELEKHTNSHYSIQRVLYSYTLIKYLNTIYKDETLQDTFAKHFGGIYYVYLRGCNKNTFNGIYSQTWKDFDELENSYKNIVSIKVDKEQK